MHGDTGQWDGTSGEAGADPSALTHGVTTSALSGSASPHPGTPTAGSGSTASPSEPADAGWISGSSGSMPARATGGLLRLTADAVEAGALVTCAALRQLADRINPPRHPGGDL